MISYQLIDLIIEISCNEAAVGILKSMFEWEANPSKCKCLLMSPMHMYTFIHRIITLEIHLTYGIILLNWSYWQEDKRKFVVERNGNNCIHQAPRQKKKPSTTNQSTYTPFGAHHLRWRQKCKFDEKNENNQTDGNLLSGYHALALKSKNRRIHTKNKQQNRTVFELYDVLKSQYFNSFDMVSSYFCYCCFSFSFAWHIVLNCSHFMF